MIVSAEVKEFLGEDYGEGGAWSEKVLKGLHREKHEIGKWKSPFDSGGFGTKVQRATQMGYKGPAVISQKAGVRASSITSIQGDNSEQQVKGNNGR